MAEAFERGLDRARARGADMSALHPYATLMLGRLDDHLQRVMAKDGIAVDPAFCTAPASRSSSARARSSASAGYRATLLAAAYRHHLHWSELIGPGIVHSMPYAWWKQFEASDIEVKPTLDCPVDPAVVETLGRRFEDFRRAYGVGTLAPEDFVRFGPTVHTLNQFIGGTTTCWGWCGSGCCADRGYSSSDQGRPAPAAPWRWRRTAGSRTRAAGRPAASRGRPWDPPSAGRAPVERHLGRGVISTSRPSSR